MHIEPGVVNGAKMALAYGTAAVAGGYALKLIYDDVKANTLPLFLLRSVLATLAVFVFFEILPHFPVGVSEVHFILGTTLLLLLGMAPAAVGLAGGLLIQGLFFAPSDLSMFFVNITTLLVPLFAIGAAAKRWIPATKPYVDLGYSEVLKLSLAYQGGIIAWVAFWVFYGQGFGVETMSAVGTFGAAYLAVVLIEPVIDLGILAAAKALRSGAGSELFTPRLLNSA